MLARESIEGSFQPGVVDLAAKTEELTETHN